MDIFSNINFDPTKRYLVATPNKGAFLNEVSRILLEQGKLVYHFTAETCRATRAANLEHFVPGTILLTPRAMIETGIRIESIDGADILICLFLPTPLALTNLRWRFRPQPASAIILPTEEVLTEASDLLTETLIRG